VTDLSDGLNSSGLKPSDCVNAICPWSGKPVSEDSLTLYRGHVVGFCNPGCRVKFDSAVNAFELAIGGLEVKQRASG
jgi:hypothetical protein